MSKASRVDGPEGHWQCVIDDVPFVCMTDERANRMRFMSPISKADEFDAETFQHFLEANFHSALDARLAIHDGVLWSVFLSPLAELTPGLAENGLGQVVMLARNAAKGDYRSGPWTFVGGE